MSFPLRRSFSCPTESVFVSSPRPISLLVHKCFYFYFFSCHLETKPAMRLQSTVCTDGELFHLPSAALLVHVLLRDSNVIVTLSKSRSVSGNNRRSRADRTRRTRRRPLPSIDSKRSVGYWRTCCVSALKNVLTSKTASERWDSTFLKSGR